MCPPHFYSRLEICDCLSANVGQESVGLGGFRVVQRAGDDLRFLFGVKFDVAKLLAKVTERAP